jgi:hypothetical protein
MIQHPCTLFSFYFVFAYYCSLTFIIRTGLNDGTALTSGISMTTYCELISLLGCWRGIKEGQDLMQLLMN